jgi:HAD superfamily hydrolase (TIGR01509 family)
MLPRLGPPHLVIFDCDGVLVDSEGISNRVLASWITETGWPLAASACHELFVGRRMDDVMATIERRINKPLQPGWLEEYERRRDSSFTQDLKPVPGIQAALDKLTQHAVAFCVASSGPLTKMHFTLGLTGLRSYFPDKILFSARGLPRGKPFPDVFLHAASQMGVPSRNCVVVEDSAPGAMAAQAAGMRCLGYAPNEQVTALEAHGATCFLDMVQLPSLLGLSATP